MEPGQGEGKIVVFIEFCYRDISKGYGYWQVSEKLVAVYHAHIRCYSAKSPDIPVIIQ